MLSAFGSSLITIGCSAEGAVLVAELVAFLFSPFIRCMYLSDGSEKIEVSDTIFCMAVRNLVASTW